MVDLEEDLRAAAYHLGAAKKYLERTGRTIAAQTCAGELSSIESAIDRMDKKGGSG